MKGLNSLFTSLIMTTLLPRSARHGFERDREESCQATYQRQRNYSRYLIVIQEFNSLSKKSVNIFDPFCILISQNLAVNKYYAWTLGVTSGGMVARYSSVPGTPVPALSNQLLDQY
jgi:hypothetical protein